jgi:hypothetical protein
LLSACPSFLNACLTNLALADFEPVNVSSLMVSADSGQAGPAQVPPQPPTNLQAAVNQNIPLSEDGVLAGAEIIAWEAGPYFRRTSTIRSAA